MSKVRLQVFLDERHKELLERLQKDSEIPAAEIISISIDRFLEEWKEIKEIPSRDEKREIPLSVPGIHNGESKDLAIKHDLCLYGTSKKIFIKHLSQSGRFISGVNRKSLNCNDYNEFPFLLDGSWHESIDQ